jgi:hypothetical protein
MATRRFLINSTGLAEVTLDIYSLSYWWKHCVLQDHLHMPEILFIFLIHQARQRNFVILSMFTAYNKVLILTILSMFTAYNKVLMLTADNLNTSIKEKCNSLQFLSKTVDINNSNTSNKEKMKVLNSCYSNILLNCFFVNKDEQLSH